MVVLDPRLLSVEAAVRCPPPEPEEAKSGEDSKPLDFLLLLGAVVRSLECAGAVDWVTFCKKQRKGAEKVGAVPGGISEEGQPWKRWMEARETVPEAITNTGLRRRGGSGRPKGGSEIGPRD